MDNRFRNLLNLPPRLTRGSAPSGIESAECVRDGTGLSRGFLTVSDGAAMGTITGAAAAGAGAGNVGGATTGGAVPLRN